MNGCITMFQACALVAEMADAPDLGSGGRPCRFDSCRGHEWLNQAVCRGCRLSFFSYVRLNYVNVTQSVSHFVSQKFWWCLNSWYHLAFFNLSSMAFNIFRFPSISKCKYFRVVFISPCPNHSWISLTENPRYIKYVPALCRRSWKRMVGNPIFFISRWKWCEG